MKISKTKNLLVYGQDIDKRWPEMGIMKQKSEITGDSPTTTKHTLKSHEFYVLFASLKYKENLIKTNEKPILHHNGHPNGIYLYIHGVLIFRRAATHWCLLVVKVF